jgi:hypothetical protein
MKELENIIKSFNDKKIYLNTLSTSNNKMVIYNKNNIYNMFLNLIDNINNYIKHVFKKGIDKSLLKYVFSFYTENSNTYKDKEIYIKYNKHYKDIKYIEDYYDDKWINYGIHLLLEDKPKYTKKRKKKKTRNPDEIEENLHRIVNKLLSQSYDKKELFDLMLKTNRDMIQNTTSFFEIIKVENKINIGLFCFGLSNEIFHF